MTAPSGTPAPSAPSEKDVQREGVALLRTLGFAVYNLSQARASKQTAGLSDSIICGHGLVAFVEWKRPGGRQSDAQRDFEFFVVANGGVYLVFRGAADVVEWWNRIKGAP